MGTITLGNKDIPIVCRQSDRMGAIKLADDLKNLIINGAFHLAKPTDKIY